MIARELEKLLTFHSGYQPGEVDQRVRPMRANGLIPFGPRASYAPHLEPLHIALVVLAMVSRRAADSGKIAMRAMDLQMVPREGCALEPKPLAVMLAAAVSYAGTLIERIEISCDGSMAWATVLLEGASHRILFMDNYKATRAIAADSSKYDAFGLSYSGHWFILTGAVIDQIKAAMTERDAGYSEKRKLSK